MKKLFYIVAIALITGCTTTKMRRTLEDVETYISQRPDSALAVIESIDSAQLTRKGIRAHHALLHAMALDKNYIDVADDSLARTAVSYYQKHGPKKRLARAMYYLALSYFYDRQHDKAIIELAKAEPIAEKHDSLYWGFTKVLQASIYDKNYNDVAECEALEKAVEIYSDINATYYINVAKHRLSQSYISNKKYDDAKKLLEELLGSNEINNRIKTQIMRDYAFLMGINPHYDLQLSTSYYEKVALVENGKYMSRHDYWVWAYVLSKIGEKERAYEITDSLKNIDASGTAYYFQYLIAKNDNLTTTALDRLENFSKKNDEEVTQILKQSISTIQKEYYQSQFEITDYKAKNRLLIIICIITISVIMAIITGIANS